MRAAFFILIALALSASLAVAEDASPKGPQEERGTFKNKRGMVIATREWRSYEDEVGAEGKPISAVVRDAARIGCMTLEFPAHSPGCAACFALFFENNCPSLYPAVGDAARPRLAFWP